MPTSRTTSPQGPRSSLYTSSRTSIGASTAIFSVVDAVVLRGLPFDEHDRLAAVGTRRPPPPEFDPARDPAQLVSIAPHDYIDWDAEQQVFEQLAAHAGSSGAPPLDATTA